MSKTITQCVTSGWHDIFAYDVYIEIRESNNTGNSATYYRYHENAGTSTKIDLVNAYPTFINGGQSFIPSAGLINDRLNRFYK